MNKLYEAGRRAGLRVNIAKTKTMVFGSTKIESHIELEGQDMENVEEFVYLGSLISWDNELMTVAKTLNTELVKQPVHLKHLGKCGRVKKSAFKPKQDYCLYV